MGNSQHPGKAIFLWQPVVFFEQPICCRCWPATDRCGGVAPSAGTLFLFGKLSVGAGWQSCCVRVPNLHYSLLLASRQNVFEDSDGEVARLEALVAADPSNKPELLKYLHVSGACR